MPTEWWPACPGASRGWERHDQIEPPPAVDTIGTTLTAGQWHQPSGDRLARLLWEHPARSRYPGIMLGPAAAEDEEEKW